MKSYTSLMKTKKLIPADGGTRIFLTMQHQKGDKKLMNSQCELPLLIDPDDAHAFNDLWLVTFTKIKGAGVPEI